MSYPTYVPSIGTKLADLIDDELHSANLKFPLFNSPHEGYAVLLEEVDELWYEIKSGGSNDRMKEEAIQVAAMAIKFIKSLES